MTPPDLTPEQMNEAANELCALIENRCGTVRGIGPAVREGLPVLFAAWQEQTAAKAGENPYAGHACEGDDCPGCLCETSWDEGAAAATPDQPTDAYRPWPIAPDTVMPPRRQPIRWGSRADDPPTEIHDDPQRTKAYLAGLAAGRTEAAAAATAAERERNLTILRRAIEQSSVRREVQALEACADLIEKGDTDA